MLSRKGLICEWPIFENRVRSVILRPHNFADVSTLNEPAFDYSVKGGACISDDFAIISLETLAKSFKVFASLRTDIFKKLENHLFIARRAPVGDVEVNIRPFLNCVDGLQVHVVRHFGVNEVGRVIDVNELLKSPLHERLDCSNVLVTVDVNN